MNFYAEVKEKNGVISRRENEVLHLISCGLPSKEIGEELFISQHTVHTHIKNLKAKLEARNIAELVRIGFELHLLHESRHSSCYQYEN